MLQPSRAGRPEDVLDHITDGADLIVPIGEWVLDTALEELARWHHATPHTRLTMSVNISTRQIASSTLLGLTADLLAKHAVDPAMLRACEEEGYLEWVPGGGRLRATAEGRLRLDAMLPVLLR